jgi:capsular exopolysaccharide synthesis family protein
MNDVNGQRWEEYSARQWQEEAESSLDLRRYLQVLSKFRWGIISMALLAGLLGLYMAFRAVPIYRSTTTLQIERDGGPTIGNLLRVPIYQLEFYNTQYELIRSWSVAEMAARRLGLLDPDYLEGEKDSPVDISFSWRSLIPEVLRLPEPEITPEIRRNNLIAGIQASLEVSPVEKSELTMVTVDNPDPEWAARVANTVSLAYIDFLRDKNLSDITGNQSWYASRLVQAREDLEKAEQALQEFLDRQGLIQTAEGVDALQSQALQMALSNREEARQQKLALERLYRQIQDARSAESLETITALESRGIVRQLKNNRSTARRNVAQLAKRYGPKHPRMIEAQAELLSAEQAYEEELQVVADAVVADYRRAVQTETSYTRQLDEAQADIQALNRNRAELSKLQDDVETSRTLFEQLQSGEKTAGLLEGGQQNINATVIEFARPALYPVRPDKQRMVLYWVLGGLLVGVGLAFLLDQLDNTFKSPEDVERRLGLPVLGLLPQLKTSRRQQLSPMSHFVEQSRSVFSEAIRTIRTGVMLATVDHPHSIVTVTSSGPSEGKTTVAINLAHAIAQMKKTVLIDADMRRPMVHRVKNIEEERPGLAALMTGEATLAEVLEESEDGLRVIPAGKAPPNPLELLSSRRFRGLIERLKKDYEMIVIDSAPALAVSDAMVVAQLADAQIYVIRADSTPYQAAEQGVQRLRRAQAPLLGCVLNQVEVGRGRYYGKYGKYSIRGRYGYGRYGYHSPHYYQEYYGDEKHAPES